MGRDYSKWLDVYRTLQGGYGARTTLRDPGDESSAVLHVAAPVRRDGRIVGAVAVAKPVRSINLFLEMARPKITLVAILAGLAITLAAWLLSLWLSRPLQRLATYAREVRDGASPPLPDLGASEVRELGRAFEEMKIALEGRAYVESYVQSLTHELKSPLTSIQAASEILSEDPPESVRERFVENIRNESSRMRDTVDRLLELSALETRTGLRNSEEIDLTALVRDQCGALEPLASRRGISLRVSGAATVRGERFLLERAFRNLLANALDFSPDGSAIDTTLKTESGRTWVEIRDRGPGIPDFAKSKVFERFYSLARPDGSRRGSGLGLPFVREALRLHGGSVELFAAPDAGTVARVVF
jgi:two-component system sensor histidine kinase CreC